MKKRYSTIIIIAAVLFSLLMQAEDAQSARKKRLPHHEYGNILIDSLSEKNGTVPVVFNHWLHRAQYTCRLCHVDLKFALKVNGSGITEGANKKGLFCGSCHNGKEAFGPGVEGKPGNNCSRCHSYGKKVKLEKNFYTYTKELPRARFGNGINWIRAEREGLISLKDTLEKSSGVKKMSLEEMPDTTIKPDEPEMPRIIFSHDKHAVWNGCDICHPSIFGDKKTSPKFTMEEIFDGKFCGTCHGKVSFPTLDCRRCHSKPTILRR